VEIKRFSQNGTPVLSLDGPMIELRTRVCEIRFPARVNSHWVIDQINQGNGVLDSLAKPEFKMIVPRIPFSVMTQVLDLFYKTMLGNKLMELEVWITLDNDQWGIYIPEQQNGQLRIKNIESITADRFIVAIIHSHGAYPPIFSTTDNNNEIYGFVYGVVGSLLTGAPDFNFRFGWNREFIKLEVGDVLAIN